MKIYALWVAVLALTVATADAVIHSLPGLNEHRALRDSILDKLETDLDRAEADGAPPTRSEVAQLSQARRRVSQLARSAHQEYFADATEPADYLFARADRPAQAAAAEVASLLDQQLQTLAVELRAFPNVRPDLLGVVFPTLDQPLATDDPAQLQDQTERTLLSAWALSCCRLAGEVDLNSLKLIRPADGRLHVSLQVTGAISRLVYFQELLLAPGDNLGPLEFVSSAVARLGATDWGSPNAVFTHPPCQLDLKVVLEAPTPFPEPPGAVSEEADR